MRWQPLTVIGEVTISEDRLGNPVTEETVLKEGVGRFTDWSSEDVMIQGREFTSGARRIQTSIEKDILKQAIKVVLDGITYEVTGVEDSSRWRLITVKRYRL